LPSALADGINESSLPALA